ncbi:hypothetical protein ScPMuIL_006632 [Solemya velum]
MANTEINVDDLKDERVPPCLFWTSDQVADWIAELGFPCYKACFETNLIDGQKLICIDASQLPNIGVRDFEHIKIIAKAIRDLLTLEEPDWSRSISLEPFSEIGLYLEMKTQRGKKIDALNYKMFQLLYTDKKWQPPLSNHCLLLPHN